MNKTYTLEKSPLYRMRNRCYLAQLLQLDKNYFRRQHVYQFNVFSKPKPNGKGMRIFIEPKGELKVIQKRLCKLLGRIETPEWLMSGKRGRSYITNAKQHLNALNVKTMDISQFYDSVKRRYVYRMFADTFKMSDDIAWSMTDLVTYKGVLPTGSPTSQVVVYWTYKKMFDEIQNVSKEQDCCFTLYVDDMTFSSIRPISNTLRNEVDIILKKYDLHAKPQKDHYYQNKSFMKITGVGIKNGIMLIPNDKRKQIVEQYKKCKEKPDMQAIEKLKGMLCAARQIEKNAFPQIYGFINKYDEELKQLARKRSSKR